MQKSIPVKNWSMTGMGQATSFLRERWLLERRLILLVFFFNVKLEHFLNLGSTLVFRF